MKNILVFTFLLAMLATCTINTDKKEQLKKLKKEQEKLTAQINALEKELGDSTKVQSIDVSIDTLTTGTFDHYIEVQGKVDGDENIGVSPKIPGVVNRILVKEGDNVKRGQVLAELDAQVLKQTLVEIESQLKFATDLYQKQKNLWDQKIGSEVQYLQAKNNKESLENRIASLKEQINMASIVAPINGTIEEIPIKVGQMAAANSPAFRIINFASAKAVAEVGEAYSARIKVGDMVNVFFPDFNEELGQRVTFASKYINPVNRTFTVETRLGSSKNPYRANMIAVIRIKDYSNPNAIAVPQNYLQASNEGSFVFVAGEKDGNKVATRRFITTGMTYNGFIEILNGLKEGDKIITAGYRDLYDGQPISY